VEGCVAVAAHGLGRLLVRDGLAQGDVAGGPEGALLGGVVRDLAGVDLVAQVAVDGEVAVFIG
jgi:hypothetical protein